MKTINGMWFNNKCVDMGVSYMAAKLRQRLVAYAKRTKNPSLSKAIKMMKDMDVVKSYLYPSNKDNEMPSDEMVLSVLDNVVSVDDFVDAANWLITRPYDERKEMVLNDMWRVNWLAARCF